MRDQEAHLVMDHEAKLRDAMNKVRMQTCYITLRYRCVNKNVTDANCCLQFKSLLFVTYP